MKSNLFTAVVITCAVLVFCYHSFGAEHRSSVSADAALAQLKEGNRRFAFSSVSTAKPTSAKRSETAQSQHPFAIIVGCADSRTSPEIIFDQHMGDLFVVRTEGNLVDDYALGSIEYAVEHLGARLIVVLGHERCGAVQAALDSKGAAGHVGKLIHDIQPAVKAARNNGGDPLKNAVQENARFVSRKIQKKAHLAELATQVRLVTGYYDLDTGEVTWDGD